MAKDTKPALPALEDEKQYAPKLTRTISFKGIDFVPSETKAMSGSFLKLIRDDPNYEGAIDGWSEITS